MGALAIYARLSVDRDDIKSIENQKIMGKEFAQKHNFDIVRYYVDEGVSGGSKVEDRPAFSELIADIQLGDICAVWVWNQDRLARDERVYFLFVDIITEADVDLYILDNKVNFDNEGDYLLGGIKAVMDAAYRKTVSKKIKRVLEQKRQRGEGHGNLPYGYTTDADQIMVVEPREAKIIKRIFKMSLEGIGARKIAQSLNDDEIPTKYAILHGDELMTKSDPFSGRRWKEPASATRWGQGNVDAILNNPIYKGLRRAIGKTYSVPAIVSTSDWDNAKEIRQKKIKYGRKAKYNYLLAELMWCGVCGGRVYGRKAGSGYPPTYRCQHKERRFKDDPRKCNSKDFTQPVVEKAIWVPLFQNKQVLSDMIEMIRKGASRKEFPRRKSELEQQVRKYQDRLTVLNKKSTRAIDLYLDGKYDKELLEERTTEISKEIGEAKNRVKELQEQLGDLEEMHRNKEQAFEELKNLVTEPPFELKRRLVKKYIKRIKHYYNGKAHLLEVDFNMDALKSLVVVDKARRFVMVLPYPNQTKVNDKKIGLVSQMLQIAPAKDPKEVQKEMIKSCFYIDDKTGMVMVRKTAEAPLSEWWSEAFWEMTNDRWVSHTEKWENQNVISYKSD